MTAAEQWTQALAAWAIPPDILATAPESPWGFPVDIFARRADSLPKHPTPSTLKALEALLRAGIVLDVGCGAGAASLPLAGRAARLIGVDPSADMLQAFSERVIAAGADVETIQGAWPEVAARTPIADVVVCNHVFYNVSELAAFARSLTDHARRRVVVELTARHPRSVDSDLWLHFHALRRPTAPTAEDALAVTRELGLEVGSLTWQAPGAGWCGPSAFDELVAWTRRGLCLSADRDPEIAELLAPLVVRNTDGAGFPPRAVVTLWWDGRAA